MNHPELTQIIDEELEELLDQLNNPNHKSLVCPPR